MSRSRRKPYFHISGGESLAYDKMLAARGLRSAQNQALKGCEDFEELIMPVKLEATHNNRYSWSCDGGKHYAPASRWRRGDKDWIEELKRK